MPLIQVINQIVYIQFQFYFSEYKNKNRNENNKNGFYENLKSLYIRE